MALDINGYNSAFQTFVKFAEHRKSFGYEDAVVKATAQPLDGRTICTVTGASRTSGSWMSRTTADMSANDTTRDLFMKAIMDMFGGGANIPASVREAMRLEDYGQGKPLTARRILAVKNAIDADGTARQRAANARSGTLRTGGTMANANVAGAKPVNTASAADAKPTDISNVAAAKSAVAGVEAEFKAIEDEVKAQFRDKARRSCEAGVRAECARDNITNADEIERRIDGKVESILLGQSAEIKPLVRQKIRDEGRFRLYDNLAGDMRPVTVISKNEETGKWTVKTLVGKDGKPLMKPVSAHDIDKTFGKFVRMHEENAILGDQVEYTAEKVDDSVEVGNRKDLHAKEVIRSAQVLLKSEAQFQGFVSHVKRYMRFVPAIPDNELEAAVRKAMGEVAAAKKDNDADTEYNFSVFVNNWADGSYADQIADGNRLAHLVARRVEYITGSAGEKLLADLDAKAGRCAQMLKLASPDRQVDVLKAKEAIKATIRAMVDRLEKPNSRQCKNYLDDLMPNGRLFTDTLNCDIPHLPSGQAGRDLRTKLNTLQQCINHYGKIDPSTFIQDS